MRGPRLEQPLRLLRSRLRLGEVRLRREAEAAGASPDLRRGIDGLQMLTLVGRDAGVGEAADVRMRGQQVRGGGDATIHVRVVWRSLLGVLSGLDGGTFTAGSTWRPSPKLSTLFSALGSPLGSKTMTLQFTVEHGTAQHLLQCPRRAQRLHANLALIAANAGYWGAWNHQTQEVEPHGRREELLNAAALETVRSGGHAFVLNESDMPVKAVAAAFFRF